MAAAGERTGQNTPRGNRLAACVFLGESKNGFVISDHADSSLPKNGRSAKGSFTMTTACPRAPREKKKNKKQQEQTDLHGEDKKKKQHKLGMNIRNVYISV